MKYYFAIFIYPSFLLRPIKFPTWPTLNFANHKMGNEGKRQHVMEKYENDKRSISLLLSLSLSLFLLFPCCLYSLLISMGMPAKFMTSIDCRWLNRFLWKFFNSGHYPLMLLQLLTLL